MVLRCSNCVNVIFVSTGEPQAICPIPTIKAVEGENVDLVCYLDPPESVVDYTVDWKRRDLIGMGDRNTVVYSYRNKQENRQSQMDQYRGRATLNHEDLKRGNLTLRLFSVQLADNGTYKCFVSKLWISCNITLNIAKRDDSSTAAPPVVGLTEPVDHGAAKTDTVRNIVIASLCGGGGVVGLAVVLFFLVRHGNLRWLERNEGARGGDDARELENLSTRTEVDPDPEEGLGQSMV
ncbi:butyrophilin-like protein 10 [Chaetodon auriga]|uniref:butyrophilin-like protein 10 n=1 Tax=Chaetodon auriga TaxID=39042 RepID=UPI004032F08D